MRSGSATLLALATGASAQNVVQFEINRAVPGVHVGSPPSIGRRAFYTEDLANNLTGGGYYATVSVGNPGQDVTMILDTGSSDAWVVSYRADLCRSATLQAEYLDSCGATYDPTKSSSYKLVTSRGFNITYLDGGGALGDYISDDFTIGGTTVKSLQMGYATSVSRGTGILGVGFSNNEATTKRYPNLIDSLASQGLISTKAYSLYLNDRRSTTGSILFGGVDTDKFIGPLSILPILKSSGRSDYTSFQVAMNGMSVSFTGGSTSSVSPTESNLPAILDSGTTLSYIPSDMAQDLFSLVGAYTETRQTGLTFIDCKYLDNPSEAFTVNFTFGSGVNLAVPVEEMVLDVLGDVADALPRSIPFDNVCLFGIQSTGSFSAKRSEDIRRQSRSSVFALLGDTFLRSAYVVYDLSNGQIGIAPANLNSTETKVTELSGNASALAAFTGVAAQQTSAAAGPTGTSGGSSTPSGTGANGQVTVTVTTGPKNNLGPDMRAPAIEVFGVVALHERIHAAWRDDDRVIGRVPPGFSSEIRQRI